MTASSGSNEKDEEAASRSKDSPAKLELVRTQAQPSDVAASSSSSNFVKRNREAKKNKPNLQLAVEEATAKRETRKLKAMSLNVQRRLEEFGIDEKDLVASEELPDEVFSAGRGVRGFLHHGRSKEHHGPISPIGSPPSRDDVMMTTTDLLKIVKSCCKAKNALPGPGTKGYQFQNPELKKQLEVMQASLRQLSSYRPLVTAIETEERVAEAVFGMLSDRLSDRLEWPQTIEFYEMRLDMMGLVYKIVGKLADARTSIASQRFSSSRLHRQMLSIIPLMRKAELQRIEQSIYSIFMLPYGKVYDGQYQMQLDLMKWLRAELLHERLGELEAGKDWACWALGELVMTIRHPKMHEFHSPAVTKALHAMAIEDSQRALNKEWDRLFFDHIVGLFASPKLENFLHPFRLAWNSLCQYSALQSSPEIGWYRVMALAEKIASSPCEGSRTAQIDFFIGLFNYGGLERNKWRRYFRVLFAMMARQLEADGLVAQTFSEPGLILELQDSPADAMGALNGLLAWAKHRLLEAETAPDWLIAQMNDRQEMYPNEQLISEVLALWTPLLDSLRPEQEEQKEKLAAIRSQWDVLRKSTGFSDIPVMSLKHCCEGLPTLSGSWQAGPSVARPRSRSLGSGSAQGGDHDYEDDGRLTVPSPQMAAKAYPGHQRQLPVSVCQQSLIFEARKIVPECAWDRFTSVQSVHVLQEMKSTSELKEEYKKKRKSRRKSVRNDPPKRSQTDTDLFKRHKSAGLTSSGRAAVPDIDAAVKELKEMASIESLELALKQLEALKPEASPEKKREKVHKRKSSARPTREAKSEPLTPRGDRDKRVHRKESATKLNFLNRLSEEQSSTSGNGTPTRTSREPSKSRSGSREGRKERSMASRSGSSSSKTLPRGPKQSKSRPPSDKLEGGAIPFRGDAKEAAGHRKSERRSHSEREKDSKKASYPQAGRSVSDKL